MNQINVTFRHVDPSQALKDYVTGKLGKIGKVVEKSFDAHVTLSVEKYRHIAEVFLTARGITIKAFESTEDLYSAIDLVCDKVERQLKKYREKQKDKGQAVLPEPMVSGSSLTIAEGEGRPKDHPLGQLPGQADDGGGCGAPPRHAPARRGDVREPGDEPAERGLPAAGRQHRLHGAAGSMRIQDIIPPEAVVDGLRAETKEGVLRELSEAVCRRLPALSPDRLTAILMDREGLGSTGIGEGVAIPHGKIPGIDRLVAVFGRSRGGVQFASLDGKPARLFFLILAPENSAGMHLKALARISRLLKDQRFRGRLLAAEGAEGLSQVLQEEDERA